MAIANAADYHFANVAGIGISGEVLPEHPDDWRANPGEDLAFLCEAAGERLAIREFCNSVDFDGSHISMSAAEASVKGSYLRESWTQPYVVADAYQMTAVLSLLAGNVLGSMPMGGEWGERWCGGIPQEQTWDGAHGSGPYDLFPELYPVTLTPAMARNISVPWTVDVLRAAYADLTARQHCLVPGMSWFDQSACRSTQTTSSGGTPDVTSGWTAEYDYYADTGRWVKTVPDPIGGVIVPPGLGSGGKMVTLWTSSFFDYDEGVERAEKTRLRVTAPGYDFGSDMVSYLPSGGRNLKSVRGMVVGYVVEANGMRTYLAI